MRRLVALAVLTAVLLSAGPAHAGLLDLINQERAEHERPLLRLNGALGPKADAHAAWVRVTCACHDTSALIAALNQHAPGWDLAGENVAAGPSLAAVVDAWMVSKAHRRNLLRSRFTHLGIGIVRADGNVWVVAWFYDA